MGKPDIETWRVSASGSVVDDDSGDSTDAPFTLAAAREDWQAFFQHALQRVLSSRTKDRTAFINECLASVCKDNELSQSEAIDVFHTLITTYCRYIDQPSREAIENVLALLAVREVVRDHIVGWLKSEADRVCNGGGSSSSAASSRYVLLKWCCVLYPMEAKRRSNITWTALLESMAVLFNSLLDERGSVRHAIRRTSIVCTRRTFRSAPLELKNAIATLLDLAKAKKDSLLHIPLLGLTYDVLVHLKHVPEEFKELTDAMRNDFISIFTSMVMSKTPVPTHTAKALSLFIGNCVGKVEFVSSILPVMEKYSLRAPDIALPVISQFLASFGHELETPDFRRMFNIAMSGAKSGNAAVRGHAETIVSILQERFSSPEKDGITLNEIITLVKSGKSSGPDHRLAMFRMLASVRPNTQNSTSVLDALSILLAKETSDAAMTALMASTSAHIVFLLHSDTEIPSSALSTILREMNGSKVALRRSTCTAVGKALIACQEDDLVNAAFDSFTNALLPALEVNIKTVSANPLSSPAGPLEGYVALACLFRLSEARLSEKQIKRNAIDSISTSNTKPYFLLWDKLYGKLVDEEEQTWLIRATESVFQTLEIEIEKNEQLRRQFGSLLVHNAVHPRKVDIRKLALLSLERLHSQSPALVSAIVRAALAESLAHGPRDSERQRDNYAPVLMACATFKEETDIETKSELVSELLFIAHEPLVYPSSGQLWIDLCQKARLDPLRLITDHKASFLSRVVEYPQGKALEASVKTLSFVAPSIVLPVLLETIKGGLTPDILAKISEEDIQIWKTPKGTLHTDILSKQTKQAVSKGKNAALDKWDAETRASLASKKVDKGPVDLAKMSKQDRELVEGQLRLEDETRRRVQQAYDGVMRSLSLLRSVVAANPQELEIFIPSLVNILLDGVVKYSFPSDAARNAFLMLGEVCSERLLSIQVWVGIAVLRCTNASLVPEELQAEPLNALILRLLYKLRSFSEKELLNGPSFSYVDALLQCVLHKRDVIGSSEDEDEPMERIMLVIEIINVHAAEFTSKAYPRSKTLSLLINIIKIYPSLGKDASSVLVAIGEAMTVNAEREEIEVLVRNTPVAESYVRNAALQCMQALDMTEFDWIPELWILRHDSDQHNARLARQIFDENALDVPEIFFQDLRPFLIHEHECIRLSCALSLPEAAAHWTTQIHSVIVSLEELFREKAEATGPEFDDYGILVPRSLDSSDPWPARLAVARSFEALAPLFAKEDIIPFLNFLITESILGDSNEQVRAGLLSAASRVVDVHGAKHLHEMIGLFERSLSSKSSRSESGDYVQEALVILLGRTARHLSSSDSRIPNVVSRLIEALKTPSEQVQIAVAECLAPLVGFIGKSLPKLVENLLQELQSASKYGERRGAAYGLAGLMKGSGIAGIVEFDLVERLRSALEVKSRFEARQGAMFCMETLAATLGRSFEPFVVELLPSLLAAFGDANPEVREATEDAAKVIMANLSGYGIKKILPSLLASLEEKQWRTKKGSIELLGTMAFCAPRQLSFSLPTVIPRLSGVLTDSHAQVRGAASKSLKQFGEVISNPEIQSMVPVLLKAFVDPGKTPAAMTTLLKKSFVHYLDSPSLALVVPIIERGLKERGSETKRKAAQIVGNLASLTDSQDFAPYLTRLLPLVHVVLVDPVPEARATAAKALGTLIERLGEEQFPDMVPGLLRTLKSDTSGVDRQGAAQGLSEVLSGLGMERLEALLPDIVSNAQSPKSTVREGFMSLLIYLPATFGPRFQPHLTKVVGPILSGLSDTEDFVRDAAMKAGRMIITNYSNKAVDLLLPELERGMFDHSWRIRHSSITLVGELLFKVTGVSGKAEIEEEEVQVSTAETSRKALGDTLGKERRDRILSALYIVRQDAVTAVRQAAAHIWKVLVHNTPRTVRELLPELINQVIALLVDEESDESPETASRTIGELCRKFGERILGEILPLVREKANSQDSRSREGVCLALCDIMENATDTQRGSHEDSIVAIVRSSLVDDQANVRAAAAKAFDSLQEHLGAKAIDQTIPTLLDALRQPGESSGTALQALKEVMTVRANAVFPVLIPTLTASPMTIFNVRALGTLVTVAGNALSKRLNQVMGALVASLETSTNDELIIEIDETLRALLRSVSDAEGLNTLMLLLLDWVQSGSPRRRANACKIFGIFCEESKLDDSLYRTDWVRQLVLLLDDNETIVHVAALTALEAFVKSVPKDELEPLVVTLRRSVESSGAPGRTVPGFSLPKGLAPMVPIIIAGLTTGSHEQRENAAAAIGELVVRTEESALKPFVVPFTGPLIRVAAQSTSYPPAVKSAILSSLTTMLATVPAFVKPFFPQLQRTFVKSTSDVSSLAVRNRAALALGALMKSQPRVDPVVTELLTSIKSNEEAIAASQINALAKVVSNAGENLGVNSRESCFELISSSFAESHDDSYNQALGSLFASLSRYSELAEPLIRTYMSAGTPPSAVASHCILATLVEALESERKSEDIVFEKLGVMSSINKKIQESIGAERPSISRPAREAKEVVQTMSLGVA